MELFLINMFGNWAIIAVPIISGILMSFIIEAIFQLTPNSIKLWYVTLLTALIVGIGISFLFPIILPTLADRIFIAAANVAVSIVFSKLVGKTIIEKLITKSVGKIGG